MFYKYSNSNSDSWTMNYVLCILYCILYILIPVSLKSIIIFTNVVCSNFCIMNIIIRMHKLFKYIWYFRCECFALSVAGKNVNNEALLDACTLHYPMWFYIFQNLQIVVFVSRPCPLYSTNIFSIVHCEMLSLSAFSYVHLHTSLFCLWKRIFISIL